MTTVRTVARSQVAVVEQPARTRSSPIRHRLNVDASGLSFGDRVLLYRRSLDMTQAQLADAAGLSSQPIRWIEWERCKGAQAETVARIARALSVPMEALWWGRDDVTDDPYNGHQRGCCYDPGCCGCTCTPGVTYRMGVPVVSEILPAGAACAQWLQEGDNARAVPFVAFAAGWRARDAEVAASEAARAALVESAERLALAASAVINHAQSRRLNHWCGVFADLKDARDEARALLARADGGGENPRESHAVEDWSEVPDFATEAEEQAYWSTHSFGEGILNQMTRLDETCSSCAAGNHVKCGLDACTCVCPSDQQPEDEA